MSDRHYYVPRVRFGHTHSSSFHYVSIMCLVCLNNVPMMCCVVLVMCCSHVMDGNPVTSPFNTLCVCFFSILVICYSRSYQNPVRDIMRRLCVGWYLLCTALAVCSPLLIELSLCVDYVLSMCERCADDVARCTCDVLLTCDGWKSCNNSIETLRFSIKLL